MSIKKTSLLTTFVLAISTFVMSSAVFPQERELPKYSAKVKINVSTEDVIEGEISSYLSRELRSLGDVEIVDKNADWEIDIVAAQNRLEGGSIIGVTISAVFIHYPDVEDLKFYFGWKGRPTLEQIDVLAAIEASIYLVNESIPWNLCEFRDHWIRAGPADDLKIMCQKLIADFDSDFLEKDRKLHQEMLRYIPPE